jgi:hypothetical protein
VFYQSVKVQVYGIDQGSGVDKVYYIIDEGSFNLYDGPVTIDRTGDHIMEFYAIDKLGNEGTRQTRKFTISPVNFEMSFEQPENALYMFGMKVFNLDKPVLIGPVDVAVSVDSFTSGPAIVDYVEFFIDEDSKMIDTQAPFTWTLDETLFGSHSITVDAVAGDETISHTVEAFCIIT